MTLTRQLVGKDGIICSRRDADQIFKNYITHPSFKLLEGGNATTLRYPKSASPSNLFIVLTNNRADGSESIRALTIEAYLTALVEPGRVNTALRALLYSKEFWVKQKYGKDEFGIYLIPRKDPNAVLQSVLCVSEMLEDITLPKNEKEILNLSEMVQIVLSLRTLECVKDNNPNSDLARSAVGALSDIKLRIARSIVALGERTALALDQIADRVPNLSKTQ